MVCVITWKLIQLLRKPLHTKRWQVGKHMPFTLVFRFQRVVMCVNTLGTQQLDRLQVF